MGPGSENVRACVEKGGSAAGSLFAHQNRHNQTSAPVLAVPQS